MYEAVDFLNETTCVPPFCVDTLRIPPPAFNPCGQGCEGDAQNPAASVYLLCLSLLSERNKSRAGDTAWGPGRGHILVLFLFFSLYTNPHCSTHSSIPSLHHLSNEFTAVWCGTVHLKLTNQDKVQCLNITIWLTNCNFKNWNILYGMKRKYTDRKKENVDIISNKRKYFFIFTITLCHENSSLFNNFVCQKWIYNGKKIVA